MTSTYATLLHKLEAEMIFALIMPLRCSAEAVMTETGHVLAGLNWNKNYFLDHRRVADIMPLCTSLLQYCPGKKEMREKKGLSKLKTAFLLITLISSWEHTW